MVLDHVATRARPDAQPQRAATACKGLQSQTQCPGACGQSAGDRVEALCGSPSRGQLPCMLDTVMTPVKQILHNNNSAQFTACVPQKAQLSLVKHHQQDRQHLLGELNRRASHLHPWYTIDPEVGWLTKEGSRVAHVSSRARQPQLRWTAGAISSDVGHSCSTPGEATRCCFIL